MEAVLLKLYDTIPPWVVAAIYALAAAGFVRMWERARRGAVVISPPVALTVAGALALIMLSYLFVVPNTALSLLAKAGFQRMLTAILGIVLIVFNASALMRRGRHDGA